VVDRDIGRSEPLISPAGQIDKAGTAPDRRKQRDQPRREERREEHRERRSDDPATKRWRRLLDLLFDEIDKAPGVRDEHRLKLRENLRDHVVARAKAGHLPEPTEDEIRAVLDASEDPDDHPELMVDIERVVDAAASGRSTGDAPTDADLAIQFRRCLEVNTSTARKVALYLTLLLRLSGALKPHISVDA